ncbi:hypothetical protein [Streptomyces acidicola]|uniref:hypothetical protein n=1 Tax=Streptomyces acidicola TaxID=2596892 RepID=UPI003436092E
MHRPRRLLRPRAPRCGAFGEFTEANGLLTPSLKIRRQAVTTRYAAEIEALYGG